jgi:hypothetical protein
MRQDMATDPGDKLIRTHWLPSHAKMKQRSISVEPGRKFATSRARTSLAKPLIVGRKVPAGTDLSIGQPLS